MDIRVAKGGEFEKVRSFYHSVIDGMEDARYSPGWKKDIYPSDGDLRQAIGAGTLFLGETEGQLCAAMVVNHACNEGYENVAWSVQAAPGEVTVIHMLCVHPAYAGQGLAKRMVDHALALARTGGQKCVRLDVLKGNLPANRLYEGKGFQYVDTISMFYEDTGWTDFELYEYPI